MNYRATCPQCASIFRLGDDQLEAAQGWVQCGVCGAAFDTRASLALADGSPLPPADTVAKPALAAAPAAPDDAAPDDTAPAAGPDEPSASAPAPGEPAPPPAAMAGDPDDDAAALPRGIAERDAPAELPSIILIDPDQPLPDEPDTLPQIPPPRDSPAAAAHVAAGPPAAASAPVARVEYARPRPDLARPGRARRRVNPWFGAFASLVLLLLLAAQLAYFLRDTVVSQWPQSRPAFEALCETAGCVLSLPRNLDALQVVGSDLQTEARDRLRLTLTLGNRAATAQAWPVLVLTLTDQRGRPLARRSFAPSEYLDDPRRIESGIPPRSEQALSLTLTVRDLAPMGFGLTLRY